MVSFADTARAEELYNEGNVNAKMGKFDAALSLYTQAINLDGSNPMYYNNSAASLKRLGRFQDAIKQYEIVVQKFPEYGKAFLSIASTSVELGEYQNAVSAYSRFFAAFKKGLFTFNPIVGGVDQAVEGDNLLQTVLITSINYLSSQQQELALKAFTEATMSGEKLKNQVNAANDYFSQAKIDFENGNLQSAEINLSKSIELNPNYAEAYYSRGYVRNDLNNHLGALDDYSHAIQVNVNYADAYLSRANTFLVLKRFQEAVEDAETAQRLATIQNNMNLAGRANNMLSYIFGCYGYGSGSV